MTVKISGDKFYQLLEAVKQFPVKKWDKEAKLWLLEPSSYAQLLSNVKLIDDNIKILPELRSYVDRAVEKKSILKNAKQYNGELQSIKGFHPIPKVYQNIAINFLTEGKRVLLADGCGLGKTVEVLGALIKLKEEGKINSAMIVCPKSVIAEWRRITNELTDYKINELNETRDYDNKSFLNVINYDVLVSEWAHGKKCKKVKKDGKFVDVNLTAKEKREIAHKRDGIKNIDAIIFDEVHRCGNASTKRSKIVKQLSKSIPYVFCVSATPLQNKLRELYNIFQIIDSNILGDFMSFAARHYIHGGWQNREIIGYKNLEEIVEKITPYVLRRTRDDVSDELPPKSESRRWVEMTPHQRKMYNDIKGSILEIECDHLKEQRIKRAEVLAQISYIRQACVSTHLIDPDIISSCKLELLREVVEDVVQDGNKMVIYCFYKGMCALIEEEFAKYGVVKLTGDNSEELDNLKMEFFTSNKKIFLMSKVGGEGLSLDGITVDGTYYQGASQFIFVNPEFNPKIMEQLSSRVDRMTQKRPIEIIHLLAKDTYEERIVEILDSKTDLFNNTVDVLKYDDTKANDLIRKYI